MVLDVERISLHYGSQTSLWVKGSGNEDQVGLGSMTTINITLLPLKHSSVVFFYCTDNRHYMNN